MDKKGDRMTSHKLESITSAIATSEWKYLDKYMHAEVADPSDLHTLYMIIRRHRSTLLDWTSIDAEIDATFHNLKTKRRLNLRSLLYGIIENYIVYRETKENEMQKSVMLVKYYNRNGIFDLADKTYSKMIRQVETTKVQDLFSSRYLMEATHYHYFSENPIKRKKGRALFKKILEHLHVSLRDFAHLYLSEAFNHSTIHGDDINHLISDTEDVLSNIKHHAPMPRVMEKVHKMVLETDNSLMLQEVLEDLKAGKVREGSDLQVFATLFGISKSSKNWHRGTLLNLTLIQEYYDYALSSGVMLKLGKIVCSRFLTMISLLVLTQKKEECLAFINKWHRLVSDESHQSVKALAHAYVMIQAEEYEDIRPNLIHHRYNDINNQIRADSLLLIGIYKEDDPELLNHQIQNFRRRTRGAKQRLANVSYQSYMNFAKVLYSLSRRNYAVVKINLQKMGVLANRSWIQAELRSEGIIM